MDQQSNENVGSPMVDMPTGPPAPVERASHTTPD